MVEKDRALAMLLVMAEAATLMEGLTALEMAFDKILREAAPVKERRKAAEAMEERTMVNG